MGLSALNEFVQECYLDYAINGFEPGDPSVGEWHHAHHPKPECLDGEDTVLLLAKHHAIHGVLQSEEFEHPCVYGWESRFLDGEMLALYKKWMSEKGRRVGSSNAGRPSTNWDQRKDGWSEVCRLGGKASVDAKRQRGEPVGYEALCQFTTLEQRKEYSAKGGRKRAKTLNNKDWMDPFDGYVGSAASVAKHMKHHGRNPKQKVRIDK